MMIVDDSKIIRRKIERESHSDQFNVVALAENGLEAIEMFKTFKPQLVTMDITMPEMDGIRCVENLIKIDPSVRILIISALSDLATGIEALEKGARGFLCKPFAQDQLQGALEELMRK